MSESFIKLTRQKGYDFFQKDPKAFLLLTQIIFRAKRTDDEYFLVPLEINQAYIGDYEKAGLSRSEYRSAQKRLEKYGLATFESTKRGTIATLTSAAVYDINAEQVIDLKSPTESSMKNTLNQPSKSQSNAMQSPTTIYKATTEAPLTRTQEIRMKEFKKTTTNEYVPFYQCLIDHKGLSDEEKQSLMQYPEVRVLKAIEWSEPPTVIKHTLIQALHWHCKQPYPPQRPEKTSSSQTPQLMAAWKYNQCLKDHGYAELAIKNKEAIPEGHLYLISNGLETTIGLNNPIDIIRKDLDASMNEIRMNAQGKKL